MLPPSGLTAAPAGLRRNGWLASSESASWTQAQEDWLASHVRLFAFLGGVPAKVVPDNLKVGVTHASYYDPVINASYAALIKHYGSAVVPARARKPRDKPGVENGVL